MIQSETPAPLHDEPTAASPSVATAPPEGPAADAGPGPEAEPAPEPMTPARVAEWNAYYDAYLRIGVLLLAFFGSANLINHSSILPQLRAGRLTADRGAPVVADPFSYTEEGRRWVNVPWLFEVGHALVYKAASSLAPAVKDDAAASAARAEQFGAGALVALDALARVVAVCLLLGIRRPGPGLWWSACCAMVLLWFLGPAAVDPRTWGQVLLAAELLLLYRAIDRGRPAAAYGLVPLFLLWANIDESFLVGLLVLAAAVLGRLSGSRAGEDTGRDPLPFGRGLAVLAACAAACLVNPSAYRAFLAAAGPLAGEGLSAFNRQLRSKPGGSAVLTTYLALVGLGAASFALNRRRFSASRLLVFALGAALPAVAIQFHDAMALILAATIAANGQEWYHDQFGTEGRLGLGWAAWSSGGRSLTIVALILLMALDLTSWGRPVGSPRFGLGLEADAFAFEAAEYLRKAPIQGKILNTTPEQGDALIWRAFPDRKSFSDTRRHLFPPELAARLRKVRDALKADDPARWRPLLDEYGISAVMIEEATSRKTYPRLMRSKDWIPFYDDGRVILFGRSDAGAADRAYFESNRLDPEALAFRRPTPAPSFARPPRATTWVDGIFQGAAIAPPQPHADAARRWLRPPGAEGTVLSDPARCLLAVREARTALARRPDDTRAFRLLADAYEELLVQESALLAGLTPGTDDDAKVRSAQVRAGTLGLRLAECLAALNFAIQTTPPPRTAEEHAELADLNLRLYARQMELRYIDLARDRLKEVLTHVRPDASTADGRRITAEQFERLRDEYSRLSDQVKEIREAMDTLTVERRAGPIERARLALRRGGAGLAIHELEDAERAGTAPAVVRPLLLNLYSDTGQPEKAMELLGPSSVDNRDLGEEPGLSSFRQGRVHFLMGNYPDALGLWDRYALRLAQDDRAARSLEAGVALVGGNAATASNTFLTIPQKTINQANWEFDTGMGALEAGADPEAAAEHLTKALTLAPDLPVRPVIAYYLGRLGKPVPPPLKAAGKGAIDASTRGRPDAGKDKPEPKAEDVPAPDGRDAGKDKPEPKAEDVSAPEETSRTRPADEPKAR